MYPYSSGDIDPAQMQRTREYQAMMAGLELAPQPQGLAGMPQGIASGFDLVNGLDLVGAEQQLAALMYPAYGGPQVSGWDLISGAIQAPIGLPPRLYQALTPQVQAMIRNLNIQAQAGQQAQVQRLVQQPRLVDNGPTAYKEQTENLTRTTVAAGAEFPWTFTILGRAAKVVDLMLPDSIAAFFDITSALVGNNNLFHGGGSATGESFATSARRTGFESDTVPAGSLVTIKLKNQDTVTHTLSARCKLKVMY